MNYRFKAIEIATGVKPIIINKSCDFGENIFIDYDKNIKIDEEYVKNLVPKILFWCNLKKVTHYTHWFSPLNGNTAEKHDAFLNKLGLQEFSYKELLQQEPDASSFPSGGSRNTYESRGYTIWDPTSPPFIIDDTLCIPSTFISYTGEALDYKTPLLKSCKALNDAVLKVADLHQLYYDKADATLGWEQEYFLVDAALYNARPDLILAGRTLFGHASAKDQQLSDHYFGVIPERKLNFMRELEYEAKLVGIPIKTRHNEVAPNQYECAPEFEELNLAVDHNQLLMYLMDKIAKRHGMVALLHEKPFDKINGSGKHCNWSIQATECDHITEWDSVVQKGETFNLLDPAHPLFTIMLVNILVALSNHNDLLRATIASASNDLRLGGHEAPPAIISAFIGSKLTEILDKLERGEDVKEDVKTFLETPNTTILKDNTDRNRTSPFAFTGNKFEFRAVGSSMNTAAPMIVLNLIVADQLNKYFDLMRSGPDVLKSLIAQTKRVRFEGDNYSEEWLKEAETRGLKNITNTPEALEVFTADSTVELFEKYGVLSRAELEARKNIRLEQYVLKLQIEGRVIGDLATNHIIPVAFKYQNRLLKNMHLKMTSGVQFETTSIRRMIENIQMCINSIIENVGRMTEERKVANRLENITEKAIAYKDITALYFELIRKSVDDLELMVDDELWPLPKYRELLFF